MTAVPDGGWVHVIPVVGLPQIGPGDDIGALVCAQLARTGLALEPGDVVVVSSKIVSKALGLVQSIDDGADRAAAVDQESLRVLAERRAADGRVTRIVHARSGPVMAAAGVDSSNVGPHGGALLLPRDPDACAADLLARLTVLAEVSPLAVVVSDTAGRPWRVGQVDFALGAAGLTVTDDLRGAVDADGRALEVTVRAVADEIAAASDLVKGKVSGVPVAVVRGLGSAVRGSRSGPDPTAARSLVRAGAGDWFAYGHVEAVRASLGVEPGGALAAVVGIPSVEPEPVSVRAERAVRLATHGRASVSATMDVDHPGPRVELRGPDLDRGAVIARLEAAAWSERLVATVTTGTGQANTTTVRLRAV